MPASFSALRASTLCVQLFRRSPQRRRSSLVSSRLDACALPTRRLVGLNQRIASPLDTSLLLGQVYHVKIRDGELFAIAQGLERSCQPYAL